MTTPDLLALADQVERLTGACRETDCAIEKLLPCSPEFARHHPGKCMSQWNERAFAFYSIGDEGHEYSSPPYTASIDAAMTLVPEGLGFQIDRYWTKDGVAWSCFISSGGLPDKPRHVIEVYDLKTTPLAITAAALRALAHSNGGEG